MSTPQLYRLGFRLLLLTVLMLGVGFRFFNLDHKVYWLDEVYSATRAAGYTLEEIDRAIFQNQAIAATDLQIYQNPKPDSTATDTIQVLIAEDAKHPPLYFFLASVWMRWMGHSVAVARMLPALLSLLSLPLMYGLTWELFASYPIAGLATGLLAVSPFGILFAQTARQYSLLTVMILASSGLLLRAVRLKTGRSWGLYALASALGLYTHLFFWLTLIGHGVMVFADGARRRCFRVGLNYLGAIALSSLLFSPWLVILSTHNERTISSSQWTQSAVGFVYLLKFWILSFTSLFFDLDFGDTLGTYLQRLPYGVLIVAAVYLIRRQTRGDTRLFLFTSIAVPLAPRYRA